MNQGIPVLRRAETQAEAGPLILMVRRANMGAFHSSRARKSQSPTAASGVAWPGRIAGDGLVRADIPRDHAAGPDHGPIADRHPGQDNGAAADPDVAADPHRAAEFETAAACFGVAWMVGGVDLRGRSDLRAIADRHFDDIQDHAVEIQENPVAKVDVVAIVAKERRADHGTHADMTETFGQQRVALGYRQCQRRIIAHQPGLGRRLIGGYFRIARTIKFAREHLLLFGSGQPTAPSFGNAPAAAANAARARALSSFIWVISASTPSNFNSSRMKP